MSDYTPGFERWWAAFPPMRRKGKGAAFKAWQRDKCEAKASDLLEVLQRQIDNDEQFRKYTPMPATYLNQRRYDDFIPAPQRATAPGRVDPERPHEQDPYVASVKRVAANWLMRRRQALPEHKVDKALQLIHTLAGDARELHQRGELTDRYAQTIRDELDAMAARP